MPCDPVSAEKYYEATRALIEAPVCRGKFRVFTANRTFGTSPLGVLSESKHRARDDFPPFRTPPHPPLFPVVTYPTSPSYACQFIGLQTTVSRSAYTLPVSVDRAPLSRFSLATRAVVGERR